MNRYHLPILMALSFSPMLFADNSFQAIPENVAVKYHFDLKKNFYANEEAFQKDLSEAQKLAEDVQQYRGKVSSSGPALYALVQKLERLGLLTQKMYVYRYLAYAVNTKLEPQLSATDRSVSEIGSKIAFVDTELRQLDDAALEKLIQEEPKLALYRFYLQQNTRYKPHTLSADKEEVLSVLSPELYSWQPQFFQKLIDRTKFSEIKTDSGTFNVYRDREVLRKDKNRKIREESLLKLYDEYSSSADLYGFILIKQSEAYNSTSTVRKFKDAFDSSLFAAYLTEEQADTFYTEIGKFAPLMQRYTKLRKERIKSTWKLDVVEPWDMDVVPPDFKRPMFTIQETTDTLNTALAFLGPQYSEDLKELLNPENHRLDIVQGENRIPGAFAYGYYGAPFVFYSFTFHGYLEDVLTLAHEGGHVVHYDLIYKNKVPVVYADGPSYFTESFAMLNEFVTGDYLYKKASTNEEKIYYLEQWLNVAMRRFFDIVMRSEFEYRAYKKIQAHEITEAAQIHELWKEEGLKYIGDDYQRHDFMKYGWSFTPHYFTSPRYYINYLFANLMAINYYSKHLNEPGFDANYVAMMVNGFPDTPVRLLEKYVKLNPFDPAAVRSSMQIFEQKLAELEDLYKASPPK